MYNVAPGKANYIVDCRDKYFKSTKLRMQWPSNIVAVASQPASDVQTSSTEIEGIGIDFSVRPENNRIVAEKGRSITIPLSVDAPIDAEKNLKIKLDANRGNSDLAKFKPTLSKQNLVLTKNDVADGKAKAIGQSGGATRGAGDLKLNIPANIAPGEYTFAIEVE